jgi:Sigma-70 region 2
MKGGIARSSGRDDVYAYVAGLLRDRAAAEDVTALAFERAYRRRRSFNPKRGTSRAWLVGAAALLPIALLVALGLAARRGWVRRQRGRALDAPAV